MNPNLETEFKNKKWFQNLSYRIFIIMVTLKVLGALNPKLIKKNFNLETVCNLQNCKCLS